MQNKQNRIEQKKTVLRRIEAELLDILKSTGHLARQKLKFLSIVYKNVLEGRTVTKRSIYYSSVNTFGKQAIVDNLIKYYSRKLESDVTWLNIVPGCKGLFCGTISLISDSNEMWYSNTNFIPRITTDTTVAEFNYKTVLVVEKESIFQRMVDKDVFLVCGKGFPDKNTLHFLTKLTSHATIHVLTDFDVYGLHIFLNYRNSLNCTRIGVGQSDIFHYKIFQSECIEMADKESKMLHNLVKRLHNQPNRRLQDDCLFLLGFGHRVEIETLFDSPNFSLDLFLKSIL